MCNCSASTLLDGDMTFVSCDDEHMPWCERVGKDSLLNKRRDVLKLIGRGIPKGFEHIIERYDGDGTFHRPSLVVADSDATTPELALYLIESLGIAITSCTDPERLATLLAGKASQGLDEKMWLEDWWFEYQDLKMRRLILPEEYVVAGRLDMKAAEAMFRPLQPELLWLMGWDENYPEV